MSTLSTLTGKVWKYGDGINTDVIFPGKYTYTLQDPGEIASHALEDLDPAFAREAQPGDIIVAGRNWGNGSSREQAVTCLKYNGIAAIVAASFGRIYYRNGLNQGLLLITCPALVAIAQTGDTLTIDLMASCLKLDGQTYPFPPLSATALSMVEIGGLVPYVRRKLGIVNTTEVKVSE